LRQRLLFIVLLVVVVLVGYTILRPKPKTRTKTQVSEKSTAVKAPATTTPKVVSPVAKTEVKSETTLKITSDTTKAKEATGKPKPTTATGASVKIDSSKLAVSPKPDTSKPKADKTTITQLAPEKEKPVVKWGNDPFVRDWVLATEIKDLKLKAVTISGTKAYALINDQILEQGEAIMGKRIVDIERDKVILEQGGRQFTLFLGE
jgi:hypothetical protein